MIFFSSDSDEDKIFSDKMCFLLFKILINFSDCKNYVCKHKSTEISSEKACQQYPELFERTFNGPFTKKKVHEVLYNLFKGVRFTKKTDFNHVPYSTVFHQTFLYPVETFIQLLKPVIEKIAILTFNIILTIFIYLRSLIQ